MSLDLLLFAAIAAFLVFRLRSILGRKMGNDRSPFGSSEQSEEKSQANEEKINEQNVVAISDRQSADPFIDQSEGELGENLRKIREADSSFNSSTFIEGGQAAFEVIITSYANGDSESLRPLLSDEVYDKFSGAISERADKGQKIEMTLVGIHLSEIIEASMDGSVAFITNKFVTEQIEVTKDSAGEVIDGDPVRVMTVTDIWTFARNTRSRNPNWTLVATEATN